MQEKKTFAVLGSVHASKKVNNFPQTEINPAGKLLSEELGSEVFSVNILPLSGRFFNFGVKEIKGNLDASFNEGFDYLFRIERATPCSFL